MAAKIQLGIRPGYYGYLACAADDRLLWIEPVPTFPNTEKTNSMRWEKQVDANKLTTMILNAEPDRILIERQIYHQDDHFRSARKMFHFGRLLGMVESLDDVEYAIIAEEHWLMVSGAAEMVAETGCRISDAVVTIATERWPHIEWHDDGPARRGQACAAFLATIKI